MKTVLLALGLTAGIAGELAVGGTLRLNIEPDREFILKGAPQEIVVKIDLNVASDRRRHRRSPLNIAAVIDCSGSMTGAKLEKAKQAATQLVDRLSEDDIFSLIVYSDNAQVVVPAQPVNDRKSLKRRIASIEAHGRTALFAGVKTGADQVREYISAKRITRVMLLSDGLANVGPSSTRDLRKLGSELAGRGIAVTTIGVGDDYNEDLMAALAEASDANYYYVKDTEKLPEIFAKELGELMTVAVREVRIEIICPDGVRPIGFIGRAENFDGQRATVKLSHLTPGQSRPLFLRAVVREGAPEVAQVNVSYIDELDGGTERTSADSVRVKFTGNKDVAAASIQTRVVAEKELLLSAIAKDEALAAADAGNYAVAAGKLESQAKILDAQYETVPPEMQYYIRREVENLRFRSQQFQQGDYDAGTRKALQHESFSIRNSK